MNMRPCSLKRRTGPAPVCGMCTSSCEMPTHITDPIAVRGLLNPASSPAATPTLAAHSSSAPPLLDFCDARRRRVCTQLERSTPNSERPSMESPRHHQNPRTTAPPQRSPSADTTRRVVPEGAVPAAARCREVGVRRVGEESAAHLYDAVDSARSAFSSTDSDSTIVNGASSRALVALRNPAAGTTALQGFGGG